MTEEVLREIVSTVGRIEQAQITAATSLTGPLSGSLARARLDAAVRAKFGVSNPAIYKVATFGQLCEIFGISAASNGASEPSAHLPNSLPKLPELGNSLRIGVDIEPIATMPAAADYWEEDFYKKTFTPREIAYALLQPSPKASFAAMWCAKEALRKAHPAMAEADWQRMEVVHGIDGKPDMVVDGKPVGALSLSHTDELAVAAFASGHAEQPAPAVLAAPPVAPVPARWSKLPSLFALLALLISILALVLEFLRP